jgi:hypothetical protein
MSYRRVLRALLVAFLVLPLFVPISGWSASLSMGTVRGIRAAEGSLDDGKNWLALGSRSLPILDGTQLRTSNGGAIVDLSDGSRLNVMPFSLLHFRDGSGGIRVCIVHGRMTFRLSTETRVEISSPTAWLEPVRAEVMQGELFVTREGTMGLKMSAGNLHVRELAGSQQVRLASIEPVFLPKRPPGPASLFTSSLVPAIPPPGSKAVFDPRGESLGYLRPDAQLVVQPGYTSNLTRPFPAKLVQLAMARIEEKNREDAVPVFDVNGGYVGYLAGPAFRAEGQGAQSQVAQAQLSQAQIAPAAGAEAGGAGAATILGMNAQTATAFVFGGGLVLGVAGVSAAGASGVFSAATPTGPNR